MTNLVPVLKELMTHILGPPDKEEANIEPGVFILTKSSSALMHAVLKRSQEALYRFTSSQVCVTQMKDIKTEPPELNTPGDSRTMGNNEHIGDLVSLQDSMEDPKSESLDTINIAPDLSEQYNVTVGMDNSTDTISGESVVTMNKTLRSNVKGIGALTSVQKSSIQRSNNIKVRSVKSLFL